MENKSEIILINTDNIMKKLHYYLNKYFYFPPYMLWVYLSERWKEVGNYKGYKIMRWIGNNIGFKGMTYFQRYHHMKQIKTILGEAINDTLSNR